MEADIKGKLLDSPGGSYSDQDVLFGEEHRATGGFDQVSGMF